MRTGERRWLIDLGHQLGTPHIVFRAGSNRTQSNPGNEYSPTRSIAAAAAARWTVHYVGGCGLIDRALPCIDLHRYLDGNVRL